MSGRPVARDLLEWDSWTYDTELACRAVVAVREAHPDRALEFFDRLQRAFYAENLDTTDPEVLAELGADLGARCDDASLRRAGIGHAGGLRRGRPDGRPSDFRRCCCTRARS